MSDKDLRGLERMNALAKELLEDESYFKLPNLRPKDAATLILIDNGGPIAKVLLGKRHHGHKFMPGKYVFPGGGVEPADQRMPTARPLDRHVRATPYARGQTAEPRPGTCAGTGRDPRDL